ncbi:MAG: ATP-binding cassette domain-containing protein, partial [Candidatus Hodarchaeota archaeon]
MNKDKLDTTNSFNKGQNGIIDQIRGFYRSTMKRIYGKSDEEKIPPTKIQQRKDIFVIFISMIVVSLLTWLISPTITILALTLTLIFGIVAISLNHQVGQTGIINFGVVGFFAVGAYATAMLSLMGWPWFFTLIGGMLFSGIVAFIVSIPSLKLREDYFAIAIITLGEIFRVTFQQEDWLVYPLEDLGFYGGTRGLSPQNVIVNDFKNILGEIPPHKVILDSLHDLAVNGLGIPGTIPVDINFLNWFNFSLNMRIGDILLISEAEARNLIFLGILLLCAIATYVIFERIYNSPIGRLNKAIREDDLATESLGFDVYRHKIIAVTLGSMFAGLAGGFLAFHQGSINPADFIPLITFMVWTIMVIGGFANHRGAILGALVVMASQPIVVNQKENITNFFVSLMVPFLPAVVDAITDLINPAIKGIGIFGIIAFPTDDPETALILLNVAIPLSFIAVTTVLALVLIAAYIKPQEWKYRKKILYLSGFLLIFTLIPFILNHLPILPILTFDFFRNVTKVQFVALSTFFINLDPLLARSIALGIIMVLFLLFKSEGALKERIIFTVDPHEQLDEYLDNKKSKENGLSHNPTEKQETVKTGNPNSEKELLHTDGLNKSFGGITALKEVSIAVKKGPLIGIIGPNGSGKSTFFNVVTGLHNQ